jgi:hypothetical protein
VTGRRTRELEADLRAERAARRAAVDRIAELEDAAQVTIRQFAGMADRVVTAETEVCRLRAQLSATQAQLDDALGRDAAEAAGQGWQERRADKRPAMPAGVPCAVAVAPAIREPGVTS